MRTGLVVAFVARLSDKKLRQKLAPLQRHPRVARIDLFRIRPLAGDKLRWVPLPAWLAGSRLLSNLYRLASILVRAGRYDVIVGCHQAYHGVFAWLAGRLWRVPVIQLVISEASWVLARPAMRRATLAAPACGVRGEVARATLRNAGYRGCVETVANPFALTAPEPRPPALRDLLTVAHFGAIKGHPLLLRVLARLRARGVRLTLGIGGDGPYRERLGPLARELGVDDQLEYLGWLDEEPLHRAYQASRAFVLSSESEGLPMVVLEAMAHGVPVFCTAVGELPWVVRDGTDGRVVGTGDEAALADALAEAFARPAALAAMGERARERVEELAAEFAPERIERAWDGLLAAAVDGARRRRR